MRRKRRAGIAMAAAASLLLVGCSQGVGMNNVVEGSTLSIGVLDTAMTVNAEDATLGNPLAVTSSAEQMIGNLLYLPFNTQTVPTATVNTQFASVEAVSTAPLIVNYQIAEGQAWSDAVPTDEADLLLAWAAASEHFAPEGFDPAEYTADDGSLRELPDDAVFFNTGWSPMKGKTELAQSDGSNRGILIEYTEPALEWRESLKQVLPAHVVAETALGISDPMVAKHAVAEAILTEDTATIRKLADAYREAFLLEGSPAAGAMVSNGQYLLDSIDPAGVVTLKPNKEFRTQNSAFAETVRIVPFESSDAMLEALRNKQINVAMPEPTVANYDAIQGMDRRGFSAISGPQESFLRLDFNIGAGKHEYLFANSGVRKAFLSAVKISDVLAVQTNAMGVAEARSSWVFPSSHPESQPTAEATGFANLTGIDEDQANKIFSEAGVKSRDVCVLFDARSDVQKQQFELMKTSSSELGWTLEDCSVDDWRAALKDPTAWDVAITVDDTSGQSFDLLAERFLTDGTLNYSGYSSPELDELVATAKTAADQYDALNAMVEIDKRLVGDAVGYPLYQLTALGVSADGVEGASMTADAPYIGQDAYGWDVKP
ncbi:ABC transporter substrate-binding protein [Agrococcus casei]|nr:ABC transporter substrate-binding protein [Agrococcus casei]